MVEMVMTFYMVEMATTILLFLVAELSLTQAYLAGMETIAYSVAMEAIA